jgi:hypothetical protein
MSASSSNFETSLQILIKLLVGTTICQGMWIQHAGQALQFIQRILRIIFQDLKLTIAIHVSVYCQSLQDVACYQMPVNHLSQYVPKWNEMLMMEYSVRFHDHSHVCLVPNLQDVQVCARYQMPVNHLSQYVPKRHKVLMIEYSVRFGSSTSYLHILYVPAFSTHFLDQTGMFATTVGSTFARIMLRTPLLPLPTHEHHVFQPTCWEIVGAATQT